jgi:hypothetical protein
MIFRLLITLNLFVSFNLGAQTTCEQTSVLSSELSKNIHQLNQAVYADLYSCLEKLSSDELVTEGYREDFWETIDNKKKFMFRCSEGNEDDEIRFLMVGKQGIETLNYPVYFYKVKFSDGSTDTASLPRNFLRFYENDREYIMMETFETVKMVPRNKLAATAKEELVSVSRVESEYFKKYENFLLEDKGKNRITPTSLSPDKISTTTPCFERIIQTYVRQIVDKEARKYIPYNTDFNPDLQKIYKSSAEEVRANKDLVERYRYTEEQIKNKVADYFFNRIGNNCVTQFDRQIFNKIMNKFYATELPNYNKVREVISRRVNY